jgi:hypothetical protein
MFLAAYLHKLRLESYPIAVRKALFFVEFGVMNAIARVRAGYDMGVPSQPGDVRRRRGLSPPRHPSHHAAAADESPNLPQIAIYLTRTRPILTLVAFPHIPPRTFANVALLAISVAGSADSRLRSAT